MINCIHFEESSRKCGGTCLAGLHGGKPSFGVCRVCPHKQMGLGDLVAVVAEPIRRALRIRKCGGCSKRRERLNQLTRGRVR